MVLLKVNSEKQEVEVAPGGGVEGQHPGSREWSAQEQGAADATGAPGAPERGGTSVHRQQENYREQ